MKGNPWLGLVIGVLTPLVLAGETGVAARVNGTDISNFRLERHFADYLKIQGRQVGAIRSPVAYKRLKREALQQLIDKELLWQEAGRLGVTVTDEEIGASLAEMQAAFGDSQGLARALDEAGFDEAGYRDYLRHELAASRVLGKLSKVTPPSDDDVRAAYDGLKLSSIRPWTKHAAWPWCASTSPASASPRAVRRRWRICGKTAGWKCSSGFRTRADKSAGEKKSRQER
jgi:peptidyl-prolyl cis-trans isomerase C